MAENSVEIILRARDEISAALNRVAINMGALADAGAQVGASSPQLDLFLKKLDDVGRVTPKVRKAGEAVGALAKHGPSILSLTGNLANLAGIGGRMGRLASIMRSLGSVIGGLSKGGGEAAAAVDAVAESGAKAGKGLEVANTAATFFGVNLTILERAAKAFATRLGLIAIVIAVVAAAAVLLGKKFSSVVTELKNAAASIGTTTIRLQAMRRVFEDAGLGADAVTTALQNMARSIGNNSKLLVELGITTRDPVEAVLQLADALALSDDQNKKNAISLQLLGKGFRESTGAITSLRAAHDASLAALKNTEEGVTDLDKAVGDKLNTTMNLANAEFRAIGATLGRAVSPAVQFATNQWLLFALGVHAGVKALRDGVREITKIRPTGGGRVVSEDRARELALQVAPIAGSDAAERVDAFTQALKKLKQEMAGKPVAAFREEAVKLIDAMAKSADEVQRFRAITDSLKDIKTKPDAEKGDREKRIDQLVKDSGLLRAEVLKHLVVVEQLEAASRRLAALSELGIPDFGTVTPPPAPNLRSIESPALKAVEGITALQNAIHDVATDPALDLLAKRFVDASSTDDFMVMADVWNTVMVEMGIKADDFAKKVKDAAARAADDAIKEFIRIRALFDIGFAATDISEQMKELLAPAALMRETFGNILSAMSSELQQSLGNMLKGTQSFSSAMTNVWRAIKDAIIKQIAIIIARIIAMTLVIAALKIVFNAIVPGSGVLVDAAARSAGLKSALPGGVTPDSGGRGSGLVSSQQVTNITNIYSYDARNAIAELTSPGGILRRAGERVAAVAAY